MNISPSDARALSLWEYEALLHHWNDDGDDGPEPIDHAITQRLIDRLNSQPELMRTIKKEPAKA